MATDRSQTPPEADWRRETIAQTRMRLQRPWGDYPLTILIINPINLRLVRMVGRTRITPNQVSLFSFFVTALGATCIAAPTHAWQALGGMLLLMGYVIDCLDGDLARLKKLKSPLGAMLDPILNRCGEIVIIAGMAIGGWRQTGSALWLVGGLALMGGSQLYFYITDAMLNLFRKKMGLLENNPRKRLLGVPMRLGAIEPFMWGTTVLALAGRAYWCIPIFNLMFAAACAMQFYKLFTITRRGAAKENKPFEIHVW